MMLNSSPVLLFPWVPRFSVCVMNDWTSLGIFLDMLQGGNGRVLCGHPTGAVEVIYSDPNLCDSSWIKGYFMFE